MKKTILLLILISSAFHLMHAQNWQPVNKFDKYNYQIDTADYITNTIWADSVELIGEDSVFYLNRIMTNCDTCSNNINNYYALKNQPQFLMRKMIKVSDSLFIFQDTSEFMIKPLLHFGEQWTFSSENNIQAIISFEGEENILGSTDSVKYIALSNGKTIILSKNHGILQFPFNNEISYILTGIEGGREVEEQVPNFWDFFDYDVGDVFQRGESGGENIYHQSSLKKYEITSKNIHEDTIIYGIEGWGMSMVCTDGIYTDTTSSYFNYSITYIDSVNHFANHYNNEFLNIKYCFEEGTFPFGDVYNKLIFKKSEDFYTKQVGEEGITNPFENFSISAVHPDLLERSGYGMTFYKIKTNVGIQIYSFESMFWDYGYLQGYIHNGDTTGTVYPDAFFEQYSEIKKLPDNTIRLYPNPANDILYLDFSTNEVKDVQLTIYDITGKNVFSKTYNNNENTINISSLNKGIYFLQITSEDQTKIEKFIKL